MKGAMSYASKAKAMAVRHLSASKISREAWLLWRGGECFTRKCILATAVAGALLFKRVQQLSLIQFLQLADVVEAPLAQLLSAQYLLCRAPCMHRYAHRLSHSRQQC